MRDYSIDLAKIAANIVTDVMGVGLTAVTKYSSDGNNIIMEFNGYPLYGYNKRGKVFVQFPRSTFYVRKGVVHFTAFQQAQCRYYQEKIGKPFAHPHVFDNGRPCWSEGGRQRATDFICNIIETLTLQNVTKDSVIFGRCASGIMGVKMEALKNAQKYQKVVTSTLNSKVFIDDRRKLETYVSKQWCSRITMLTRVI